MRIIGVTGKIATGKNTTSAYLKQYLHCPVFDADQVVHNLYQYDQELILNIAQHFPHAIEKNQVNRKKLSQQLIAQTHKWHLLENIVHPRVIQELHYFLGICYRAQQLNAVINMPLLFSTGSHKLCHMVITLTVNPTIQRERLIKRAGYNDEIINIIQAKQDDIKKDKYFVINTGNGKRNLFDSVIKIINHKNTKLKIQPLQNYKLHRLDTDRKQTK